MYLAKSVSFCRCLSLLTVLCLIILKSEFISSLKFHLNPNMKRCISHEMYKDQLATGEYEVSSVPGTSVDLQVKDSQGHIAFSRDNIDGKGKFAVTSDKEEFYLICFEHKVSLGIQPDTLGPREISLDYKVGVEAKSYDAAGDDLMKQIEVDLNKIEDITNSIIADYAYLRKRNFEMHDTNESTKTKVFYQTVVSVIILLVLASWQVLYLRQYFKSRKLID